MQNPEEVQRAAACLAGKLPENFRPRLVVACGTGHGEFARLPDFAYEVPFRDIPGFPTAGVASHKGLFAAGFAGATPVLVQLGRCHLYEGYSPAEVCMGVRVARELGAEVLILANAAGCLNPHWNAGDLMLLVDHINCTGASPLTGPNCDAWGPRFPDMSRVYDPELRRLALEEAGKAGIRLEQGVYLGTAGPELETPAQTRFFRRAGADAVGMSTVLEAVAARHMGMRVLAFSCLSNKNMPDCMAETDINEIIAVSEAASANLLRLLAGLLRRDF